MKQSIWRSVLRVEQKSFTDTTKSNVNDSEGMSAPIRGMQSDGDWRLGDFVGIYERPQCPNVPVCYSGTCTDQGHESLFPTHTLGEMHKVTREWSAFAAITYRSTDDDGQWQEPWFSKLASELLATLDTPAMQLLVLDTEE